VAKIKRTRGLAICPLVVYKIQLPVLDVAIGPIVMQSKTHKNIHRYIFAFGDSHANLFLVLEVINID